MFGRRAWRCAAYVLLYALLSACDQPTSIIQPPSRRLLIHAVLDGAGYAQWVTVKYLYANDVQGALHIPGSRVTITPPGGQEIVAKEVPANVGGGYYFDNLDPVTEIPIIPGGTYTLHVTTPAGEEASGTTTMPVFIAVSRFPEVYEFDRLRDTLRLTWNRIQFASRYQVFINSSVPIDSDLVTNWSYSVFTDTTFSLAGTSRTIDNDPVFPAGGHAIIGVFAVDDNYYTYYRSAVDPFAGAPPSRLQGAVGVFGAIGPARREVQLSVR